MIKGFDHLAEGSFANDLKDFVSITDVIMKHLLSDKRMKMMLRTVMIVRPMIKTRIKMCKVQKGKSEK